MDKEYCDLCTAYTNQHRLFSHMNGTTYRLCRDCIEMVEADEPRYVVDKVGNNIIISDTTENQTHLVYRVGMFANKEKAMLEVQSKADELNRQARNFAPTPEQIERFERYMAKHPEWDATIQKKRFFEQMSDFTREHLLWFLELE